MNQAFMNQHPFVPLTRQTRPGKGNTRLAQRLADFFGQRNLRTSEPQPSSLSSPHPQPGRPVVRLNTRDAAMCCGYRTADH